MYLTLREKIMSKDSTLAEIVMAYRKAKVDLYRSSDPRIRDIVEYEENLFENLTTLARKIEGESIEWISSPEFLGTYTFAPETIKDISENGNTDIIWSDSRRAWERRGDQGNRPNARFRLMSQCGIDMHVLATFWMITVGDKLESKLGSESMGNRIARDFTGNLNRFSSGTFQHYSSPYGRWRDGGLRAMSDRLRAGKSVITLTADVTSFYHRLNPGFLLDKKFMQEVLEVELTSRELKTHKLFVESILAWARHVSAETGWDEVGLPVGLPASAVIANLALVELDRVAIEEFKPAYYGRYVDDIILVIEEDGKLDTHSDVWNWLIHRSRGLLRFAKDSEISGESDGSTLFDPPYLNGSRISFDNRKNKIFHLAGPSGEAMVGSIRRAIDARSSEWRSFSEISSDPRRIGRDISLVTQKDGEPATSLRDADQVSVRRSAFAIKLRDFEDYERNLNLESWSELRIAFFESVSDQILVLPNFFDFSDYIPRLIKLAAACNDWVSLKRIFDGLASVINAVRETCDVSVKSYAAIGASEVEVIDEWCENSIRQAFDNLASGSNGNLNGDDLTLATARLKNLSPNMRGVLGVRGLRRLNARLHERDLAHIPYRFSLLEPDYIPLRSARAFISPKSDPSLKQLPLDSKLVEGANLLLSELKKGGRFNSRLVPLGREVAPIVFATRPPNQWELFLAMRRQDDQQFSLAAKKVHDILAVIRGYSNRSTVPNVRPEAGAYPTWVVESDHANGKVNIALATVNTELTAWKSAALGKPDLNARRYERFKRLFQEATSRMPNPDYILLPEFAMPSQWFVSFADKLRLSRASLVSGIEYRTGGTGKVRNQVWASLRTGSPGARSYSVFVQDKQKPAPFERSQLNDLAGLKLEPEVEWQQPVVIAHGDFRFALLICSELTNIDYRSALRGRIDALFVPEWNQDLHTFDALVESAALDIHAYIVQANHLSFGDSRIRAPRSKEWERDVVRLRGGLHDYVVIGQIDYWPLRAHQSALHVPKGDFKPIPDGFEIAHERRRLP